MKQYSVSSFLSSLCLHLGVFALILLWPAPQPPLLKIEPGVITGDIVTINPGRRAKGGTPADKKTAPMLPGTMAKADDAPTPQTPATAAKPEETPPALPKQPSEAVEPPTPAIPEKKPPVVDDQAARIGKKPEEKQPDKPQIAPAKNATAQKADKQPEKPQTPPAKNATAQKPDKPQQKPPKPKPSESADDIINIMKNQVAQEDRKARTSGSRGSNRGGSSDYNQAINEFNQGYGGDDDSGGGPGGSDGNAWGIAGSYKESIVSRVQPNWHWVQHRADRKHLRAIVTIQIAKDGTITQVTLAQSSGNTLYDQSLINAVRKTEVLESPPSGRAEEIDIVFDLASLSKN